MRRLFLIPWLIFGTFAQQKVLEDLGISFHNFIHGVRQSSGGLIFGDLRPHPDNIHQMPMMPIVQPVPTGLEILHPPSKSSNQFFTIPPVQQQHEVKFVDLFHADTSSASPTTAAPSTSPTTEAPPAPPLNVEVEPPRPPPHPVGYNSPAQASPERLTKIIPKAISSLLQNASGTKTKSSNLREIPNNGGFDTNLDSSRYRESADVDVFEIQTESETAALKPKEVVDGTTSPITPQPTTSSTSPSTEVVASTTPTPTESTTPSPAPSTTEEDSDFKRFLQSTNLTEQEADVLLRFVEKALDEEVKKKIEEEERHKVSGIKIHEEKDQFQSSIDDDASSSKSEDLDLSQKHSLHQLKTAETHLSIDLKEEEEASGERGLRSSTTTAPLRPTEPVAIPNTVFSGADDGDYRSREQAEFDRLVSGQIAVVSTAVPKRSTAPPRSLTAQRSTVSARILKTTTKRVVEPQRTVLTTTLSPVVPYRKFHHAGPPTEFERLASDYRVRLSGHNGFNDFIKALRNANIGFFERPTYTRYNPSK
ncbi:hypothetical protein QR680_013364 [Steinernema hermaphroditum]|uniref:Uncharacterized protein n=1 Tax=Steinernema hermaphroditum TaxID=289476 RepID=A0AA39I5A0_9BILA|nr:hypothetical protein QR680_013364 [Steinernema hermaphroditum]